MEQVRVERLDHLGLIASVMKDLALVPFRVIRSSFYIYAIF